MVWCIAEERFENHRLGSLGMIFECKNNNMKKKKHGLISSKRSSRLYRLRYTNSKKLRKTSVIVMDVENISSSQGGNGIKRRFKCDLRSQFSKCPIVNKQNGIYWRLMCFKIFLCARIFWFVVVLWQYEWSDINIFIWIL